VCNLYSDTKPVDAMRQLFAVEPENDHLGNAAPQPAIFPKGTAPIIGLDTDGTRWMKNTHSGFVRQQV
tara:strand:- start:134 stop:337 length:204 start_codon:yes stop_codon:yes gene_type:complete